MKQHKIRKSPKKIKIKFWKAIKSDEESISGFF